MTEPKRALNGDAPVLIESSQEGEYAGKKFTVRVYNERPCQILQGAPDDHAPGANPGWMQVLDTVYRPSTGRSIATNPSHDTSSPAVPTPGEPEVLVNDDKPMRMASTGDDESGVRVAMPHTADLLRGTTLLTHEEMVDHCNKLCRQNMALVTMFTALLKCVKELEQHVAQLQLSQAQSVVVVLDMHRQLVDAGLVREPSEKPSTEEPSVDLELPPLVPAEYL